MPNQLSDQELVTGCRKNDRRSQEALYRRYFARMMRMVMRYANDQDTAMDILNNGFLRVFKKIDKYEGKGSLEGWIRRLIFHAISDYFRGEKCPIHFLELEEWSGTQRSKALDELYFEDLLKLVKLLPDSTRKVFHLYAIEGFSHREIAEKMKISEGTSKWHLSEARKRLRILIHKQNNAKQHAG